MRIYPVPMFLLIVATVTCASSGSNGGPRRSSNRITQEELADVPHITAWTAIKELRPRWLTARGVRNIGEGPQAYPQVYVDGHLLGDPMVLHSLAVLDIESMEFMSASDATTRFGTGHQGGAILVQTKR